MEPTDRTDMAEVADRLPRDPLREALGHAYWMGVDNALRGGEGGADTKRDDCVELAVAAYNIIGAR